MKSIVIALISLVVAGCAAHVPNVVPPTRDVVYVSEAIPSEAIPSEATPSGPTPTSAACPNTTTGSAAQQARGRDQAPTPEPQGPQALPEKEDNFSKAGDLFAAGSRFVYDSASGTWSWIREEKAEHQDTINSAETKAAEAAAAVRDAAKRGVKKVQQVYSNLTK